MRELGFSENELKLIRIAGYLHDIGKVAIPIEILEKPDILTEEEYNIIKLHAYYSYRILEHIEGLELINEWGSFHHERLDGSGYPFGIKGDGLSLGSRIIAIADVFTALIEDRPYRRGMDIDEALDNIRSLVRANKLDRYIFSVLERNVISMGERLSSVKQIALGRFSRFYPEIKG
ncbi:MAG: HD-GYP domain-containing protein [bacterium]